MNYPPRPADLSDAIIYHFRTARADRERATETLLASLNRSTQDPETIQYLLRKVCRQLIHEHARNERIKTPRTRNLMDYPIRTDKYLSEATCTDLATEFDGHASQAEASSNKSNFFASLHRSVCDAGTVDSNNPDPLLKTVLTEQQLDDRYNHYILGHKLP